LLSSPRKQREIWIRKIGLLIAIVPAEDGELRARQAGQLGKVFLSFNIDFLPQKKAQLCSVFHTERGAAPPLSHSV
jgi:hypothetical protein